MYHPGRLWGVVLASMTIGFVIDTYFVMKGIRGKRMGLFDVLISLSVPYPIVSMLTDDQLTPGAKIIDSMIGFVCIVSAVVHIYVLKRKMPKNKKTE